MAHLDFKQVIPNTYNTTPEERLAAHLVKDLKRQYPDRTDVHFELMAKHLAAAATMIAGRINIEDYSLTLKRPADLQDQFHNLADQ